MINPWHVVLTPLHPTWLRVFPWSLEHCSFWSLKYLKQDLDLGIAESLWPLALQSGGHRFVSSVPLSQITILSCYYLTFFLFFLFWGHSRKWSGIFLVLFSGITQVNTQELMVFWGIKLPVVCMSIFLLLYYHFSPIPLVFIICFVGACFGLKLGSAQWLLILYHYHSGMI